MIATEGIAELRDLLGKAYVVAQELADLEDQDVPIEGTTTDMHSVRRSLWNTIVEVGGEREALR